MNPPPGRLLLIKPGSLGDVIHALPVASAIKSAWPACEITWLVDPRWRPLLAGNSNVDKTFDFPRENFRGAGMARFFPWISSLSSVDPDICVDLQGLLRSALMARASGARQIVGLSDAREGARFFYSSMTPVVPLEHSVRRYLRALAPLKIPIPEEPSFPLPMGSFPEGTPEDPYVLIHPFARGKRKSLDADSLAQLCKLLAPLPVVLVGGPATHAPSGPHVTNLLGKTSLLELTGLIRNAAFVVSVDSGPAHIAAAANTPLLAIHTWSDPRLVGPFSESAWIWQGGEIRHQRLDGRLIPPGREPAPKDTEAMASHVKSVLRKLLSTQSYSRSQNPKSGR
jgi:ADP-heptose:LPS heptosyltransferase